LEFVEKNKSKNKTLYVELDEESEIKLDNVVKTIEDLIYKEEIPSAINKSTCKKCAYYEYCYI